MKKKKVKKIEIGKKKEHWFSRNRYQDHRWDLTQRGEVIESFDVIDGEKITVSVNDWEFMKDIKLSESEYNIYYERLVTYWEERKCN
jgi:hypothetical protein